MLCYNGGPPLTRHIGRIVYTCGQLYTCSKQVFIQLVSSQKREYLQMFSKHSFVHPAITPLQGENNLLNHTAIV